MNLNSWNIQRNFMERYRIVCNRFDNTIQVDENLLKKTKRIRIGSQNPNKLREVNFTPIATNGNIVLYNNTKYNIRNFLIYCKTNKINNLIVLKINKRNLIID